MKIIRGVLSLLSFSISIFYSHFSYFLVSISFFLYPHHQHRGVTVTKLRSRYHTQGRSSLSLTAQLCVCVTDSVHESLVILHPGATKHSIIIIIITLLLFFIRHTWDMCHQEIEVNWDQFLCKTALNEAKDLSTLLYFHDSQHPQLFLC